MKSIIRNLIMIAGLTTMLTACDKTDDLKVFGNGNAPVLSASAATITPLPADSNKAALTFNWSYPNHATDTANIKYIVEIDSAGKNFANPFTRVVTKSLSTSIIAKELNAFLLSKGYTFNVPVDMDVRLISSYTNNNERLISNTVRVKMTPYKIPPRIALPASGKLFIVGGATVGGWNNPVPAPSQELARMDETTFGGIFQLTTGQSYLLLPVNGDWSIKYGFIGSNNSNNLNGDDFKQDGGDLMAPATSGLYKLIVNFQTGKFSLTPYTQQYGVPAELYIVGDATPGGWNNPVPVPTQKFTKLNSAQFEIASIAMIPGKNYLFLPENGSWGKKFGAVDNTVAGAKAGTAFKPEGQDMPSPDVAGNYKLTVDFLSGAYKLVKL